MIREIQRSPDTIKAAAILVLKVLLTFCLIFKPYIKHSASDSNRVFIIFKKYPCVSEPEQGVIMVGTLIVGLLTLEKKGLALALLLRQSDGKVS